MNNYKAGKEKKEEDQLLNYSSSQLTFFSKSRFVPTKQHLFFQDNGLFDTQQWVVVWFLLNQYSFQKVSVASHCVREFGYLTLQQQLWNAF